MTSEAAIQNAVRRARAHLGYRLFRNNVGVLTDARGVPVRYGLANDSAALNRRLKSSDLIGWRPVVITPDMAGKRVAVFTALECKPSDWTPAPPTNRARYEHEQAQRAWLDLVAADGGEAAFVTGDDE